jgi:phosphoglycerate dehydrogenase-like enzyme
MYKLLRFEGGNMNKIKKALLFLSYPEKEISKIVEALDAETVSICSIKDGEKLWEEIKDAEVVFTSYPLMGLDKREINNLRWLHADMAGLDLIYTPEIANRKDLIVTAGNGRSSHGLAEHALMFMLNLGYCFPVVYEAQKTNTWLRKLPGHAITLAGKTVALFGVGSVGTEIARRCKAFGMNVHGFVRNEEKLREPYDKFFVGETGKKEILNGADFVVIAMPLSDETYHSFGKEEFDMMKDSAYIVNMSRGPIINEKELINELQNKKILGFAADSFEFEPLDPESPLWKMENVIVTPHATPSQPGKQEYMTELVLSNIEAYKNGKPLKNVMQPFLAYSGPSRYNFDLASKLLQKISKKGEY